MASSWSTTLLVMNLAVNVACGLLGSSSRSSTSFRPSRTSPWKHRGMPALSAEMDSENNYESTDAASKGIVSSLTALVKSFSFGSAQSEVQAGEKVSRLDGGKAKCLHPSTLRPQGMVPRSPQELLERIGQDYVRHNYLWTGNLDLACFNEDCRFTDPTISFTGTAQFVRNLQNLQPLVQHLVGSCRSELLDIELLEHDGCVQTRWKMVGDLDGLPWKPKVNVIGRTKFWYEVQNLTSTAETACTDGDNNAPTTVTNLSSLCYQVTSYDEAWEIPAHKALLQLVTPAG